MFLNCSAGEDSWEPLGLWRSNQSVQKEINPEYSLEGLMLKLNLQYFGHLMWRADSLEKSLMLGKIEGRRRRGWQRMRWLWHRRQWGLWAEHLVFVKRSKTEPLFSPRHSKDRASGKSWAVLKQRDKVASPEVKEDFPVCTCTGRLLESQQQRGPHPIISVDTHP